MDKELKAVLTDVTRLGREFVKAGNALITQEFGDDIRKIASEVTDVMIEAGIADARKREAIVDALVFDKGAALTGLRKVAERSALIPVGVVDSITKAADADERSSEDVWEENWKFRK